MEKPEGSRDLLVPLSLLLSASLATAHCMSGESGCGHPENPYESDLPLDRIVIGEGEKEVNRQSEIYQASLVGTLDEPGCNRACGQEERSFDEVLHDLNDQDFQALASVQERLLFDFYSLFREARIQHNSILGIHDKSGKPIIIVVASDLNGATVYTFDRFTQEGVQQVSFENPLNEEDLYTEIRVFLDTL